MTNLKTLRQKTAQEANMWQPAVFDYANKQAATEMDNLIESGVIRCVYDSLDDQLRELVTTRQPQRKKDLTEAEIERDMAQILNGTSHHTYGRWVFYPWSQALVHVLPPAEFRELRLNRNHYKITPEEQARLAEKTVGIVGLSVGNAVALTIAREGACGHLKLADFDELSLSNMNRIRAGVQDIGIKKTVLAARQIFELNPYARISLFSDGLSQDNMDAFLCGAPRLDILIDECDGLRMKIALRERARVLQILVL
ncbi:MAG: ThiF family adenylyltransferase, partial [Chloroflexota bacterium]